MRVRQAPRGGEKDAHHVPEVIYKIGPPHGTVCHAQSAALPASALSLLIFAFKASSVSFCPDHMFSSSRHGDATLPPPALSLRSFAFRASFVTFCPDHVCLSTFAFKVSLVCCPGQVVLPSKHEDVQ